MHELSIASQILDSVLAVAAEHKVKRVDEVSLSLGALRMVVPEALQMAWQAVTEGTVAAGAALKVTETPVKGRCRACGHAFAPPAYSFACPACGKADVKIEAGNEIVLTSMTCTNDEDQE